MVAPYILKDLTPDDHEAFLGLLAAGGGDYAFWSRGGKTHAQIAQEHMRYLAAIKDLGLQDMNKGIYAASGALVGTASFSFSDKHTGDLSLVVARPYRGKGLGTWAALEITEQALSSTKIKKLETTAHPQNKGSLGILKTLGARRIALVEESAYRDSSGRPEPRAVFRASRKDLSLAVARHKCNPYNPR